MKKETKNRFMFKKLKNPTAFAIIVSFTVAYAILVVMLGIYNKNVSEILSQRFNSCVRRSLLETARLLEDQEMLNVIEEIAEDSTKTAESARIVLQSGDSDKLTSVLFGFQNPASVTHLDTNQANQDSSKKYISDARQLRFEVLTRLYNKNSHGSIKERIDPVFLRETLAKSLEDNGIPSDFSFAVVCREDAEVEYFHEKPFEFDSEDEDIFIYEQVLFRHDIDDSPLSLIVKVNRKNAYIHRYAWQVVPILLCMTILLGLLIYTIHHAMKSERLTQIQKAFVKNMTHELKTPVASISLASEMISDPTIKLSPESLANKAQTINSEAKRLTQIIERVLQTSVLEREGFEYSTDDINVNDLITKACESFSLKVQQNGGKILTHLNATAPVIYADKLHVTNVVFNLMDNAFKYRDAQRPLILEVVTRNEGKKLLIDFTDNGIGIEPKYIKHIFDKFYRVPSEGERHDVKGFGLGLNYVKNVVTHNGGNIVVESEVGVGTRFTLEFDGFRG